MPPSKVRQKLQYIAAAMFVICSFAGGIKYIIERTAPVYLESASVVFSLPKSKGSPNAYLIFAKSLITSGEAMTQILGSPQTRRQILEAGGTGTVNLALVNLYDQEYPNYGLPLATLTASSSSAASAHDTFVIAARLLPRILATLQDQAGVRSRNRISAQIVGRTGLTAQAGSSKRVLAGLAILASVAFSALRNGLGRRGAANQGARDRQPAVPAGLPIPAQFR